MALLIVISALFPFDELVIETPSDEENKEEYVEESRFMARSVLLKILEGLLLFSQYYPVIK